MNPVKDPVETSSAPKHQDRPNWWNDKVESSWNSAKKEAVADWDRLVGAEKKVTNEIAEDAMAFGHGARSAYDKFQAWGNDLEKKLEEDWTGLGKGSDASWDKVRAAVQHQWQRAAGTTESRAARAQSVTAKVESAAGRVESAVAKVESTAAKVESTAARAVSGAAEHVASAATSVARNAKSHS